MRSPVAAKPDACLLRYELDGVVASAADFFGDRFCVGVGFQRGDDPGARMGWQSAARCMCGGEIDACLCADAPDGGTAHAADLSGDGGCVGVGFQRRDDLGALFGRNKAPRFIRCREVDARLSGDLRDGVAAYVADLSGDFPSVGVCFQRRDNLGALLGWDKAPLPDCGGEADACLSSDLADGIAAHAADLSGDGACVGVCFQRRNDFGALFGRKLFHTVGISYSKQRELNNRARCCESLFATPSNTSA